jgi:ATP-binding cassette subfamily B protein
MNQTKKHIYKTFTSQHDQQDCGVACLLSLIRYYGGDASFERIRELSGTSKEGSSLLGLYQAAASLGFVAEGCEADTTSLINHGRPVILHILTDKKVEHFVVCYMYDNGCFIIGDPANGICEWSSEMLNKQWLSHACLILEPSVDFEQKDDIIHLKRKWLKNLIVDDIGILLTTVVIGTLLAALGMAMAVFSQKLIDDILPSKDYVKLSVGLGMVALLILTRIGLSVIRQHLLLRQARDFNNRIVGNFYNRLLFLPKSFFDHRKVGDMTTRLNDTRRIQIVISQVLGDTVINVLSIFVSFVFLFMYSWQLTLPIVCSLPLFFWVIYSYNKCIIAKQREMMAAYAQSESNFINTIQGISTIKNYNKQSVFSELNQYIYGIFQDTIYGLGNLNVSLGWKSGLIGAVITLLILILGSLFVFSEQLSLGRLMAVLSIIGTLLPSIAAIAMVAIPFNEAKVAFDRMFEFLRLKPEKMEVDNTVKFRFQSLQVTNLSFRFPGRGQLLQNINLTIHKSEIISIAGESGCGKTTFCQILSKFYDFENGNIVVNDKFSIRDMDTQQWREVLGVVLQDAYIFNGTVLSNICLNNTTNDAQKVINFCHHYNFEPFIDEFPQGYMTIVGEEGINLSGGQKQLISLARALYKQPQLLILDEVTSAMDKNMEHFVLQLLLKLKKEMSIIFVSHRLHILKNISDKIYLFDKGIVSAAGTHKELIHTNNLYSSYWKDIGILAS